MFQKVRLKFAFTFCLLTAMAYGQKNDQNNDNYSLVENWPQFQSEEPVGQPSGLGLDGHGHIFVFHRAGADPEAAETSKILKNTVAKLDVRSGKLLESWGAGLFAWPHGLTMDYEGNVWVTDVALHQVFKFAPDGKLLMTLGEERVPGDDHAHFNKPSDVVIAKDGSIYISDGYGNSRIVKFSADGEFLLEWGEKGTRPGQFNLPHSLDIDSEGNIIVADRENARIQKFDSSGTFLAEWKNTVDGKVYAVQTGKGGHSLFAVDYLVKNDTVIVGSDISSFGPDLDRQTHFGRRGDYYGPVCRYHDIEVDDEGNIYTADLLKNRIQKFQRVRTE